MIRKEYSKDLSAMNTFGMKVSCSLYMDYDAPEDLPGIDFQSLPAPVLHMGGGSNLLFTGDFPGTVLHSSIRYIKELSRTDDSCFIEAGAGIVFDDFVRWTCGKGLWGAENLSLIPGEVGASAVQNIGAYGADVKDIIDRVLCFDTVDKEFKVLSGSDCEYGYRDSAFKGKWKGRFILTGVIFKLSVVPLARLGYGNLASMLPADTSTLSPSDVREAVIALRHSKLPDPSETGSAGSFFKNPVVSAGCFAKIEKVARDEQGPDATVPHYLQDDGIKVPAAWMIDRCALKGISVGGAALYERQPLVIVNRSGNASPEDILALERLVIEKVKEKFGVELHPEVEHIKS